MQVSLLVSIWYEFLYRQKCSDCKIYSSNVKQRSFKPDFSLKHAFTNQYIAINRFSEKNGYVVYFQKKPSQVPEKTLDLFPVLPCPFFFVLLVSVALFFRSARFVLAVFLSVVFEEPVAFLINFFLLFFLWQIFFQPLPPFHWIPHRILPSGQKTLHLIAMTRMANALELILRNMEFNSLKKTWKHALSCLKNERLKISNVELCNKFLKLAQKRQYS